MFIFAVGLVVTVVVGCSCFQLGQVYERAQSVKKLDISSELEITETRSGPPPESSLHIRSDEGELLSAEDRVARYRHHLASVARWPR